MILLMWALTGPEWICLLPQRCGIMGCHIVLLLHFYTLKDELWLTKAFKGERIQTTFTERWISLKTQFTFENSWSFSLRSLSILKSQNDWKTATFLLLFSLSSGNNKIMSYSHHLVKSGTETPNSAESWRV